MMAHVKRNYMNLTIMFGAFTIISLLFSLSDSGKTLFTFALPTVFVTAALAMDYLYAMRKPDAVLERAKFLYWLRNTKPAKTGLIACLVIAILMGAFQFALLKTYGSIFSVIKHLGAYYPAVLSGQYWRLFIGPFFHDSLTQYTLNATTLILVGWLSWTVISNYSIPFFILSNALCTYTQMTLGGHLYDNLSGISGGIDAMVALFVFTGLIDGKAYPKGFALLFLLGFLIPDFVSTASLSHTAVTAHIAGIVIGAMTALGISMFRQRAFRGKAAP